MRRKWGLWCALLSVFPPEEGWFPSSRFFQQSAKLSFLGRINQGCGIMRLEWFIWREDKARGHLFRLAKLLIDA
jgi:hypothetical protein